MKRLNIFIVYLLIFTFVIPVFIIVEKADATIDSTYARQIDAVTFTDLPSGLINQYACQSVIKISQDSTNSYFLACAVDSTLQNVYLFTYSITHSGTISTTTIDQLIYNVADTCREASVCLINATTSPPQYGCIYRRDESSDYLQLISFGCTDAGGLDNSIIDVQDYGNDATHDNLGSPDCRNITDGYIIIATTFENDAATDSAYAWLFTVNILSDGDISSVPDSGSHQYINNSNASPADLGRLSPITDVNADMSGQWSTGNQGAGWWMYTFSLDILTIEGTYVTTFYVDSMGDITIYAWMYQLTTDPRCRGFAPRLHNSDADGDGLGNYVICSAPDTGGQPLNLTSFNISASGSASIIEHFEFDNLVTSYYPDIIPVGLNRYIMFPWTWQNWAYTSLEIGVLPADGDFSISDRLDDDIGKWPLASTSGGAVYIFGDTENKGWMQFYATDTGGYPKIYTAQFYLPPSVSTLSVSGIDDTTADAYGKVDNCGTSCPSVAGFCWSDTEYYPTTSGSHSATTQPYLDGATFDDELTNLSDGTLYYLRAYATSTHGTSYGNTLNFITRPAFSNIILSFTFDANDISGTPSYTVQDQSANNHDGVFVLAENPAGISGTLGCLLPVNETDASYLVTDNDLSWGAPDEPENMYEEQALEGLFGIPGQSVDKIADWWGVASAIIWALVATVCLVMIGFGTTTGVHSPMFTALMQGSVIFLCYVMGIFPGWLALSYPFAAMGVVVSRKFY